MNVWFVFTYINLFAFFALASSALYVLDILLL